MLIYKNPKAKPCEVCERLFVPERDGENVCCALCGLKRAREEAPKTLSVTLPWPDAALSPNRKNGHHWGSVNKAKGKRLADARHIALQAMVQTHYIPPKGLLPLTLTFVHPDKRRRDLDNLLASMKADLDGLSHALGVDDQVFEPVILRRAYSKKNGCVLVEVGGC